MPDRLRSSRSATRLAVTSLSGIALLVSVIAPAWADAPMPVYPSVDQVAGAKAAVQNAAGQVAQLDQQLGASRDQVETMQQQAGDAGEAYNGARLALETATTAAADAGAKASAAQATAGEASLTLSRYAAEIYQGGGGTSQLDIFFGGGGPQDVLDRAAGVDAVGGERARMVQEAESTKLLAQSLQKQAAEAEARRAAASAAAQAAAEQAKKDADTAVVESVRLEAGQQQMTVQLAALRNTSVQLEQERQSGLAAEEQRRREEANRRAVEAAAAAAAQKTADEAAAQVAAARAAADAAARDARNARQRADAEAARQAAVKLSQQQAQQQQARPPALSAPAAQCLNSAVCVEPNSRRSQRACFCSR